MVSFVDYFLVSSVETTTFHPLVVVARMVRALVHDRSGKIDAEM